MLNEQSGAQELPVIPVPAAPAVDMYSRLRTAVEEVFFIESESTDLIAPLSASYTGTLTMDSEAAYAKLDDLFKPLDHVPVFAMEGKRQVVRAIKGRYKPRPRPITLNVIMFVLTVLSLLFVGASTEREVRTLTDIFYGLPYAISVLLILGTHELGHYFAARAHGVAVTLPYFIPMPIPGSFGTLGAFIQLREPMRNRRILLDIGAAGPLAGFIVAVPILLIGLATSKVGPTSVSIADVLNLKNAFGFYSLEGNSILYALAKMLVFGRFLPDGVSDVFINQMTWAGWTGLLVTAINLIPIGQLDGGHVMYSLFGERARLLYIPVMLVLGALSVFFSSWLLWVLILFMMGRIYATPLDMITPLDNRRRWIGIAALIVFVLVFVPMPLQTYVIHYVP